MKKVSKQTNEHTIYIALKSTNESGCITAPGHIWGSLGNFNQLHTSLHHLFQLLLQVLHRTFINLGNDGGAHLAFHYSASATAHCACILHMT